MKVKTSFYRRLIFGYRSLHGPIPNVKSQLPITVTDLTANNLEAYLQCRPNQDRKEIAGRIARGHRCSLTYHEGQIVEATWVAVGSVYIPYLRIEVALESTDVFGYDAFVVPAYRGKGLYMAKIAHIMQRSRELGYARLVAVVAPENRASVAVLRRIGARPALLYSCLRFGPWQRVWKGPLDEREALKMIKAER